MARPRRYATNAERQAAYRARQADQDVDPSLPVREIDEPVVTEPIPERTVEQLLVLPVASVLTASEEQALRDHFGYTASERRTRAERAATAARISDGLGPPPPAVIDAMRGLEAEERRHREKVEQYRQRLQEKKEVPSPARR